MFHPKRYSKAERQLAGLARKMAMRRDVLYHGTRHAQSILTMGVLFPPVEGEKVCFTRSAEEAAYWASLERDNDEGQGAILIFNRQLLRSRYRIEPYHDPIWDEEAGCRDEAEEEVWGNVINVGRHLIGFVSGPTTKCSNRLKTLNREYRLEMEARLNELLYHVPDWRHRPEKILESSANGKTGSRGIG